MRYFGSPSLPAFLDRLTKGSADTFNKYWRHFDERIHALEELKITWQAAVAEVIEFGLLRIEVAIAPVLNRVIELASLGFLTASSNSIMTLVVNQDKTFIVNPGAQRDLFTPTKFIAITRISNYTDYAVGRVKSYDKETGGLVVTVMSITGNPGPFADWEFTAMAGATIAQRSMLDDTLAAKQIALDKATQASTAASTSTTNLAAINSKFTVSTSAPNPAVGNEGDIWIKVP